MVLCCTSVISRNHVDPALHQIWCTCEWRCWPYILMFQWMVVQFNRQRAAQVTCDQQLAVGKHWWWENSKIKPKKWWQYKSLKNHKNPWPGYGGQWPGYGGQWSGYSRHWSGYGSHWPGYGAHPWNVQNMSRSEVSVMILTDSWDMQRFCTTNIISDWLKLANSIPCPFCVWPATYFRSLDTDQLLP